MLKTRQLERLTPESHETLLTILETLPGALFVLDDAATILYANASAQALTGVAPETLVGNSFWRCAPQLVSTALYQAIQQTKQTRALTEAQYVSPVTQARLHVHLSPTGGGLTLQFHEMGTPSHRQEIVPQRESLYMDVLDHVHAGIIFLTSEGIVLDLNEVPLDDAQIRREEVVGKPLVESLWWPSSLLSQVQLRAALTRASRGETVHFETEVHPREGMDLSLEVAITPRLDADHHIEYLVLAGIDITARKRAEAELHALIDSIPQQVWTMRPDGSLDYANQRWLDYSGLSTEQTQGDGWIQCLHPDDQQRILDAWQMSLKTGTPFETEQRLRQGATGEYRWFLVRAIPVRDDTGQILKWFGTCTDIEEQKRTEQKLKASEENLSVLAETVPQLVWTTQPDGLVTYWNQRWCDYLSLTAEQIQNDQWAYLQFIHPDDQEGNRVHLQHALETGALFEHEERIRHGQTGEYRWFLSRGMPVRDEAGQILKWFGTCTDIEDQKRVEQQLKESRENWRVLAETMPQFVWTAHADGRLDYVNQQACDYGYTTREHLLGDGWRRFLHPDDFERARADREYAFGTGQSYAVEYRLRNGQTGEYRWFLTRGAPVRDEAGQIVKWIGTNTDIEDQKRTEEALRQSQERIRALIDSNIIGITSTEMEGEVLVDANEAFLRMTGYTREEVQSRTLNRMKITPPEKAPLFERSIQELAAHGQQPPFETELVCKDGSRLPVLAGGVIFQDNPRQMVSFVLDNSASKELEQRKDDFISMASHELRNPLTAMKLQTTLLRRQLAKQGTLDQAPALASLEKQIKKVNRLVKELFDVSKIQAGRLEYIWEVVDLNALLQEITETLQQTNPSHTLVVRGTAETSLIGDHDRLGQVFINLIRNAIKYSPDDETVEIDLSSSDDVVTVSVRDHGLGIPRELRDKIFERFYRVTDPKQKRIAGLGMGLYIVAEILKGHGGTITVDSAVGTGSTFTVTIPKRRKTFYVKP